MTVRASLGNVLRTFDRLSMRSVRLMTRCAMTQVSCADAGFPFVLMGDLLHSTES